MKRKLKSRARRGNVIVLSAFLMIGMMGLIAFAVDLGYLYNVRTEMQRAADASAIAACWELIDDDAVSSTPNTEVLASSARTKAQQFVTLNLIAQSSAALSSSDVEVGYIANPTIPTSPFVTLGYTGLPNAVRVRVRRTDAQNGQVPLFFGPVLGVTHASAEAEAVAAYLPGVTGFKAPSDGSNLGILPYALDQETWNGMLAGVGTDQYRYIEGTGTVSSGPDGILEVNLFPQGTGSPGNRGTVDIGSANNSTNDIARQIVHGISAEDLSYMPGNKVEIDSSGKLYLNGDTGISAGVKDELGSITGQPRMIPIFSNVTKNGNNAEFTIVKFVGVRLMHVDLTGGDKSVMVQPAVVLSKGAIPSSTPRSDYIYSPVWLVR